jgi:hypothetical protein
LGRKVYMLNIPSRINLCVSITSGLDSLEFCLNKEHFLNYQKKIKYKYNSQGFRDAEWPNDLSNVIWCVGDSFTVGLGQPFEETWPQMLERRTGKRCLNLGEDGCSNDTIALRAQEIYKLHNPKLIVVMWSYFQRRRINGENIHYDVNDFGSKEDMNNFLKNFKIVNSLPTTTIHLLIPGAFNGTHGELFSFLSKSNIKNLMFFPQIDRARDYHHFDIETSKRVCELIIEKINYYGYEIDKI